MSLYLSSNSASGYTGVYPDKDRFKANTRVDGKQVHIGMFGTAVEAAVAYARYVDSGSITVDAEDVVVDGEDDDESDDDDDDDDDYEEDDDDEEEEGTAWVVGDRVEAQWGKDDDEKWWLGKITRVHDDGTVDVRYDDKDVEKKSRRLRPPPAWAASAASDEDEEEEEEEEVEEGRRRRRTTTTMTTMTTTATRSAVDIAAASRRAEGLRRTAARSATGYKGVENCKLGGKDSIVGTFDTAVARATAVEVVPRALPLHLSSTSHRVQAPKSGASRHAGARAARRCTSASSTRRWRRHARHVRCRRHRGGRGAPGGAAGDPA